jgi:hypothetical protein
MLALHDKYYKEGAGSLIQRCRIVDSCVLFVLDQVNCAKDGGCSIGMFEYLKGHFNVVV